MQHSFKSQLMYGLALWACAIITFYLYQIAFAADWYFDDAGSFQGLELVQDLDSALIYIFGNEGFTSGRLLSLASFLLNAADWPSNPAGFRYTNALIHLLNGMLIAWLAVRIARLIPALAPRAAGFAVTLAALWLLHPFLASTLMMTVQRMTELAALFTLLGLLGYVHGRGLLNTRPLRAYVWMSGSLFLGTILGLLAKENGALLPLLAGALELTVLSIYAPIRHKFWLRWKVLFFGGPLLLLVGYIAWQFTQGLPQQYLHRPFDLSQRLLSESVILLEYLRQILIPNVSLMGPYQDDLARIRELTPLSGLTLLLWIILPIIAWITRHRAPAFAFAVWFFLAGHLIESTVFPLELYFEHRNYVPMLGPLGALVGVAWSISARWPRIITGLFIPVMAVLLWRALDSWADPINGLERWSQAHPSSLRATYYRVQQHQDAFEFGAAAELAEERYLAWPQNASLGLLAIRTRCGLAPQSNSGESLINLNFLKRNEAQEFLISRILENAPAMKFSLFAVDAIHSLVHIVRADRCNGVSSATLHQIIDALLANASFGKDSISVNGLHYAHARLYLADQDWESALEHLQLAFDARATLSVVDSMVNILLYLRRFDEASNLLQKAINRPASISAIMHQEWIQQYKALQKTVNNAKTSAQSRSASTQ